MRTVLVEFFQQGVNVTSKPDSSLVRLRVVQHNMEYLLPILRNAIASGDSASIGRCLRRLLFLAENRSLPVATGWILGDRQTETGRFPVNCIWNNPPTIRVGLCDTDCVEVGWQLTVHDYLGRVTERYFFPTE